MSRSTLKVKKRIRLGKGGSKQVRKEGKIPAVIYGKGSETIPLIIDPVELKKALATESGRNTLLDLEIDADGKKIKKLSILKDVQIDYVLQKPIHLDFQTVNTEEKVAVNVPLNLTGRAQGLKEGGILEQNIKEINVECLPENIPTAIEFDISDIQLGEAIHIKDINLPEEVEALGNPGNLVASIQIPRAMITETVSTEEGEIDEEEAEAVTEQTSGEESDSGDSEG